MPNLSDYDPAVKYGANLDVNVDLADIRDANDNELIELDTVASAVNYLGISNAATGNAPVVEAKGDDTNIPLFISSKGTGSVAIYSGSSAREILVMNDAASAVNYIDITPAATGSNPAIAAVGDDTNISFQISPKGTGLILIGDSSSGTEAGGSVTINAQRGVITTSSLTTAAGTAYVFSLVNNRIGTNSQIFAHVTGGGNTGGLPVVTRIDTNAAGSCTIHLLNATGGSALNGTVDIAFIVLS